MDKKRITLGSHYYPAKGEDARRQNAAVDSWRALPGVDLVDLQFAHLPDPPELPGFRRVRGMRQDSVTLTGAEGRRKPIVSEMFDLLAREALAAGNETFVFSNSDILMRPETIAAIHAATAEGCKAQVFSRMDFDGKTGRDLRLIYPGQDSYAVDARWWLENRWRFRPYVVGETSWDNAYTSIFVCHAPTRLHNRVPLTWHEDHDTIWHNSPFQAHNLFLLTLDSRYYHDWCVYCDGLRALRTDDQPGDDAREDRLRESFRSTRFGWRKELVHAARVARTYGREWLARARRGRFGVPPHRSVYEPG